MIRWVDGIFYQFSNSPNHGKLILIWEIWGLWWHPWKPDLNTSNLPVALFQKLEYVIENCFRFLIFEDTSKNPSKCSIPMPNGYHQWLRTEVLPPESVLRVWKGHSRSISGQILSLLGSLWPSWGSCGSPLGRLGLSWCIFWARPSPGGDWIVFGGGQSSQVW